MCGSPELLIQRIRELSRPLSPQPTGVPPKLARLKGIKAVFFDVYGTLFISGAGDIGTSLSGSRADSLHDALSAAGFTGDLSHASEQGTELIAREIEKAQTQSRAEGIEYPEIDIRTIFTEVLHQLTDRSFVRGTVSDESVTRVAVEYELRVNPVWPMPALNETLAALRRKGLLLGIISNAQFYTTLTFRALLADTPEKLGFEKDLITWSFETLEAKPSFQLFTRTLHRLEEKYGILPGESLHVGNCMLNDIWPASRAGCKTALFAGDRRSYRPREEDPRCSAIRPDTVITNLQQVVDSV
jgi:putative hydrolase of the HAD superfamily